jgi:hypothetical protein
MVSRLLPLLALLLGLQASCRPPAQPGFPVPISVWCYLDLTGSNRERTALFDFARGNRIRELFLGAHNDLKADPLPMAALLQAAQDQGLAVSLVLGRDAWVQPELRSAALAEIRAIRDFTRAQRARGGATPSSLQLDVEPHTLPDWEQAWPRLGGQYLDLLEAIRAELQGELPLWLDIPTWWDRRPIRHGGRTQSLETWAIALSDRVIVMDYRNTPEKILAGAATALACGARLHRPVTLGLAVHCDPDPDNASTSFCRKGRRALNKAMTKVDAKLSGQPGYGGLALFTFEDWRQLRP